MHMVDDCSDEAIAVLSAVVLSDPSEHVRSTAVEELAKLADPGAKRTIADYIELFHNPRRLHSRLGRTSPVAFERAIAQEAALAA